MKVRNIEHDNWATPKDFYDNLNDEFHFDFDPCPLNNTFNGLEVEWGNINYINPPYSRKLKEQFIKKAYQESLKGKTCVLLLPVSTSTKIFHDIILPNSEIRFIKGRIKFCPNGININKCGQMDSMLVIFKKRGLNDV